jgi:hypothetical protein
LPAYDKTLLKRLEELVKETFLLWDEIWVGFSWRHYHLNHTQRVRALSLEIGKLEGADLRKLEYSALLHDITKRYDGEVLTDSQGKQILDENGFWHNELLMPKRENLITRLYSELDLFGKLHNVSGALIAEKLLNYYDLPNSFSSSVGSIIRSHLNPDMHKERASDSDALEKRILYEADTIDSNIGLPAFYRNVQIRTHYVKIEKGVNDLEEYVSHIDPWIISKTSFLDRIKTKTGKEKATRRINEMKRISRQIEKERKLSLSKGIKYGLLGIIKEFMDSNEDPNLQDEMSFLKNTWIPQRGRMLKTKEDPKSQAIFEEAEKFCSLMLREIDGL